AVNASDVPACWLVVNPASGSNDAKSTDTLAAALTDRGVRVDRVIAFPDDPLPDIATLDAAGIGLVVVYTGDGTVNALVNALGGWSGAVLVLPGGTMNLLARRLHRNLRPEEIIDVAAGGVARRVRVGCVRTEQGLAFADVLVGPGARWSEVRESMRSGAIVEMATGAIEAIRHSATGPFVKAPALPRSREDGYPLIELTPGEHGIQVDGFYAEAAADYVQQAWSVLRHRFREGPHDRLGMVEAVEIASIDGSALDCLIDGEPAECPSPFRFIVAPCGVDLLATAHDL
ncbi:MAG: diacylglycerol/lipid kinase family protein, partial [Erythrobacter sp.]